MPREKMPDLKRKGNWKNAPDDTPKKKETKKAPVGQGAKPKAKPARTGAGAKPKPKPARKTTTRKAPDKGTTPKRGSARSDARSSQSASVKKAADAKKSRSPSNRKPQDTGARSQNTSGTGYKEGSLMDRITRARRGTLKKKKKAPVPASRRKWGDQSA